MPHAKIGVQHGHCPVCGKRKVLDHTGRINARHFPCTGAGQFPMMEQTQEEQRLHIRAVQLLANLDRCEHGRHEGERCFGCPGNISTGNLLLSAGQRIGTDYSGRQIVVPADRELRRDPRNWYLDSPTP